MEDTLNISNDQYKVKTMKKINDLESQQKQLLAKIKDFRDKSNAKAKVGIFYRGISAS